ncbi:MAG: hypothetical protein HQL21_01695 [Candidatus Omnitrophica bacterium]|nr:hypothetical protein [Candidatus Omnitrophota bacterium]
MKIPTNWEHETKLPLVTSCKQAARLVSISVERNLSIREFLSMRIHLWMCKTCTRYRNQMKALRNIFLHHEEVLDNVPASVEECLDQQAKEKIKAKLLKKA